MWLILEASRISSPQFWTRAASRTGDWQMSAPMKPEAWTSGLQCVLSPLGGIREAVARDQSIVLIDTRITDPSKLGRKHKERGINTAT